MPGGIKRKQFSDEQIIEFLKRAKAGAAVSELCREHGVSDATDLAWKAMSGGLEGSDAKRLPTPDPEPQATAHPYW